MMILGCQSFHFVGDTLNDNVAVVVDLTVERRGSCTGGRRRTIAGQFALDVSLLADKGRIDRSWQGLLTAHVVCCTGTLFQFDQIMESPLLPTASSTNRQQ